MQTITPNKPLSGPRPIHLGFNLLFGRRTPIEVITEIHAENGPLARVQLGNRTTYFVNDPDLIKYILQDNNRNYVKGPLAEGSPLIGNGLLTSEGEFWRRQRRLAQPAFHRKQIEGFAQTMAASTEKMLNEWEPLAESDQSFNLADEMMKLTLDIVASTLFGNALTAEETESIMQLMPILLRETRRYTLRARWIGDAPRLPQNRRYLSQISELDQIIERLIAERRASGEVGNDLLGMFLSAVDEETGESMSDRQLRDEVMTLFLAGHETTANLLAWCWRLLHEHPEVLSRVVAEIDDVLLGLPPKMADMRSLPYTQMVLQESLRLYPPAWLTVRSPIEADEWRGNTFEPGCNMMICLYTLHRSPDLWENPDLFIPERFEDPSALPHRFAFIPFGGGPRLCIGRQFALMEATIILAMMVQRYKVMPAPDAPPIVPETAITMRPKDGVWVEIANRT